MKKSTFLTAAVVMAITILASAQIMLAQSQNDEPKPQSDDPNWIDPAILKQLQDIPSIDRSKIKPDKLKQIALQLTKALKDVTITVGKSEVLLPEMNIPHQRMMVVNGRTKAAINIRGESYPPGLEHESFYNENGDVVAVSTTLPSSTTKPLYPVGMDPENLKNLKILEELRAKNKAKQ
jgi:hypothetical protein